MRQFFADLHLHVGRALGRPVKVSAGQSMTLAGILEEAQYRKGIQILGIIDAASPLVLAELRNLKEEGILTEVEGGGLRHSQITLILGAEVELLHPGGPAHYLLYFPTLEVMEKAAGELGRWMTNPQLSSQRCRLKADELVDLALRHGGFLALAHAFTPHKGFYGSVADHLGEVFSPATTAAITVVELGLSADTFLADRLSELHSRVFLSNSDAHSPGKIGREYNLMRLEEACFAELQLALQGREGRGIMANYGLDPRLGKYHRTFCLSCGTIATAAPPVRECLSCGSGRVVMGVLDRIHLLADTEGSPAHRPPYYYQVPLEFIPGLGPSARDKLIRAFGSEMAVLHEASREELAKIVGPVLAERISLSQKGQLNIETGGGGIYGRLRVGLQEDRA